MFPFSDTGSRSRDSRSSVNRMGGSDSFIFQSMGQDQNATPLPAGLQTGAAESARDRCLHIRQLQRPAFASGKYLPHIPEKYLRQ